MENFIKSDNFDIISNKLSTILKESKSFKPHIDKIPEITSKGIYFWFMHPEGYNALSTYIKITPINPVYKKDIGGASYDLVYIGTAGTGKKGNSNLKHRFVWHINEKHTHKKVYHRTLSTLRSGLGSLIADNLIIPNTEQLINDFLKKYMKVYWIEYSDNKSIIDNDENILITNIKALFNLKNNPNAGIKSNQNTTQVYKKRRLEVYSNSIKFLE
jgi:hypothetical protein